MDNNKQWSSRWMFILAATGSAVGLGNIWKFPYMTGENGGSAFVLLYLGCVLLVGLPVLIAEIMLGRRGAASPMNAMRNVAIESGCSKQWQWLGFAGILTSFLLLSYYSVIAGQAAGYIGKGFSGAFDGKDAQYIGELFDGFTANPFSVIMWHTFFIIASCLIVIRGLRAGLERGIRWMVPGLFVILLLLVAYASTTTGFQDGLKFLCAPKWDEINGQSFLAALGHAFFTLSIATGSMLIYGAYLGKSAAIGKTAIIVAIFDTGAALLAGMAIFPLVFSHGLEPAQGPALVFKTLPIAFGSMPLGHLVGGAFFILLLLAALTSAISMIEPIVAWVTQNTKLSRPVATFYTGASAWLLGIGSALSFNVWKDVHIINGWNFYEIIDNLVSLVLMPAGGLLLALFAGWFMQRQFSVNELQMSATAYQIWQVLIRFVAPIAVFIIFYTAI